MAISAIKLNRERLNMTQRELADKLGVTPKAISFYELGQRNPPKDLLIKMAQIFGTSTDELLGVSVTLHADTAREKVSEERQALLHLVETLPEERLAEAARYLRYLAGTENRNAKGA